MTYHIKTQVLRDTHFRAEAPGEGITEEDKARYLASARAIVRDGLDDADVVAKGKKAPKFHRTAAQDWLLAADHVSGDDRHRTQEVHPTWA